MPRFAVTSFEVAEEREGLDVKEIVTTYLSLTGKKYYLCIHWISSTPSRCGHVQDGHFTFLEIIIAVRGIWKEYTLIDKGRKDA